MEEDKAQSILKEKSFNIPENKTSFIETPYNPLPKFISRKLSIFLVLLIGVTVIIGLTLTIYESYKNKFVDQKTATNKHSLISTPSPTPNKENQTEIWKAYFNSNFNFSLDYPDNWTLEFPTSISENTYIRSPNGDQFIAINSITLMNNSDTESFIYESIFTKDIVESMKKEYSINKNILNNYDTFKINKIPLVDFYCDYYFITEDNQQFIKLGFCSKKENNSDLNNEILSTFQFTNNLTDTSTWKTYTSTVEKGLSFKYPSNWKASSSINENGGHGEAKGTIEIFSLKAPSGYYFSYKSYPAYGDGGCEDCYVTSIEKVTVPNFKDLYIIENAHNEIVLDSRNIPIGVSTGPYSGNGINTKTAGRNMEFIGNFGLGDKKKNLALRIFPNYLKY